MRISKPEMQKAIADKRVRMVHPGAYTMCRLCTDYLKQEGMWLIKKAQESSENPRTRDYSSENPFIKDYYCLRCCPTKKAALKYVWVNHRVSGILAF